MVYELESPIIQCSLEAGRGGKGGVRKLTLHFSKVTPFYTLFTHGGTQYPWGVLLFLNKLTVT